MFRTCHPSTAKVLHNYAASILSEGQTTDSIIEGAFDRAKVKALPLLDRCLDLNPADELCTKLIKQAQGVSAAGGQQPAKNKGAGGSRAATLTSQELDEL